MSTTTTGMIAVPDLQHDAAGCITWWRLSGDTDLPTLTNTWTGAGLDSKLLPGDPSPVTAMGRVSMDMKRQTPGRFVRELAGARGWVLVDEHQVKDSVPTYDVFCTLRLNDQKRLRVTYPDGSDFSEVDTFLDKARAAFAYHLGHLSINDVSAWMSRLIHSVKAVALRDTGGVYFVPREQLPAFRAMVDAISHASSHKVFEVPALKSESAVEAILDAIAREAETETEAMETEVDGGDLGVKALNTRARRCDEMREKVETYEQLLGRSMETLRKRIEGLKASVVMATLAQQNSLDAVG